MLIKPGFAKTLNKSWLLFEGAKILDLDTDLFTDLITNNWLKKLIRRKEDEKEMKENMEWILKRMCVKIVLE